jgi:hypothetical protein
MRLDVATDLSRSATDFACVVWPHIAPWLGGGELVPVEAVGDPDMLDIYAGIDAWHLEGNAHRMRGIASRVQYPPNLYASFTIRSSRTSGAETELAKRLEALYHPERGWLLPAITVQAYVAGGALIGAGCVYTRDLYLFVAGGRPGLDYLVKTNGDDANEFYAVWWSCLREHGVRVRTFGEERLADYWCGSAA